MAVIVHGNYCVLLFVFFLVLKKIEKLAVLQELTNYFLMEILTGL